MRSFLNELKRRNVFRAAAAYSVVAWVTAQGSSVVLPAFNAPEWALRVVIIVLLAGLPLTLLLAWIYELTPQGLKRTEEQGSNTTDSTPRVLDSVIILGLVIAVIFTGLARDAFTTGANWMLTTAGVPGTGEQRQQTRLAVLPFVATNTDLEAERFSHGFSSDLAISLRALQGVTLVGMESAEFFESRRMEARQIGKLLNARWLLKGSLRRSEKSVRIEVQLLDANGGQEVLSLSFNPGNDELHDVRKKIRDAVASQLAVETRRTAEESGSGLAPVYAEWLTLLGRLRHATPEDLATVRNSAASLAERAPKAGELRAAHAYSIVFGHLSDGAEDYAGKVALVRRLLEEAMTLAPNSARVLEWRAEIESRVSHWEGSTADYERISASLQHALDLAPNAASLLGATARHAERFGDYPQATEMARRALERDPLSVPAIGTLVRALAAQGRFEEARESLERFASIADAEQDVNTLRLAIAMQAGHAERAVELLAEPGIDKPARLVAHIRALASLGRMDAVREQLAALDGAAADEWRLLWTDALEGRYADSLATARRLMNSGEPGDARRLGILATQAGDTAAALEIFLPHFAAWFEGNGPLRGRVALETAPWFAHALRAEGRVNDARRVLDRHLAGVLLVETELAKPQRDLLLAANFIESGRDEEAMARLSAALGNGFDLGWGVYCEFAALPETVLFAPLQGNAALEQLARRIEQRRRQFAEEAKAPAA